MNASELIEFLRGSLVIEVRRFRREFLRGWLVIEVRRLIPEFLRGRRGWGEILI
jgi:hypothetical protein